MDIGTDPTVAGAVDAAETFREAAYRGDYSTMRTLLTPDCQQQWGVADLQATIEPQWNLAAEAAGITRDDLNRAEARAQATVDGDTAQVTIESWLDGELFVAADDAREYVYVDGAWRTTTCEF